MMHYSHNYFSFVFNTNKEIHKLSHFYSDNLSQQTNSSTKKRTSPSMSNSDKDSEKPVKVNTKLSAMKNPPLKGPPAHNFEMDFSKDMVCKGCGKDPYKSSTGCLCPTKFEDGQFVQPVWVEGKGSYGPTTGHGKKGNLEE